MEWYLKVVRDNYANFNGRARRQEYWMFILFNIIFAFVATCIDTILATAPGIYLLYGLAVLVPGWAVMCRRFHDVGKSGWFWLIIFIPIIGFIWFLILMCTDGDKTENRYGPSPKGFGSEDRVEEE